MGKWHVTLFINCDILGVLFSKIPPVQTGGILENSTLKMPWFTNRGHLGKQYFQDAMVCKQGLSWITVLQRCQGFQTASILGNSTPKMPHFPNRGDLGNQYCQNHPCLLPIGVIFENSNPKMLQFANSSWKRCCPPERNKAGNTWGITVPFPKWPS